MCKHVYINSEWHHLADNTVWSDGQMLDFAESGRGVWNQLHSFFEHFMNLLTKELQTVISQDQTLFATEHNWIEPMHHSSFHYYQGDKNIIQLKRSYISVI